MGDEKDTKQIMNNRNSHGSNTFVFLGDLEALEGRTVVTEPK